MKRRFAWLLAALLLLSVCAASAEYVEAFPNLTVTGELTIDGDAAREAMAHVGVPEDEIDRWTALLSLLSGSRDTLIIADEGVEYRVTKGDGETMTIAGESRDGRTTIVSSLFPAYSLTCAASDIPWAEIAAASDAVVGYVDRTIDAACAAVKPGAETTGTFEFDGETFDTRTPLDIDAEAMASAGAQLVRSLMGDATLREAGLDALSDYSDFQFAPSRLPAITAARYSGDGESATLYTAELTSAGAEPVTVTASVRVDGPDIRVKIAVPDQAFEGTLTYAPTPEGASIRAEARYGGIDYAVDVDAQTGETASMTTTFYVNDMSAPVATEVNTFALKGERTIVVNSEGKTALEFQDVLNNENGAATQLLMALMTSSLSGLYE